MGKVGFNKYAALDVEFKNQVVAIKKEPTSPVDSIQLQKNIEQLMSKANMQNIEEDMLPDQTLNTPITDTAVSKTAVQVNAVPTKTNSNPIEINQSNQNTAKTKIETQSIPKKSVSVEKPKQIVKTGSIRKSQAKLGTVKVNKAQPKAVMPKHK